MADEFGVYVKKGCFAGKTAMIIPSTAYQNGSNVMVGVTVSSRKDLGMGKGLTHLPTSVLQLSEAAHNAIHKTLFPPMRAHERPAHNRSGSCL